MKSKLSTLALAAGLTLAPTVTSAQHPFQENTNKALIETITDKKTESSIDSVKVSNSSISDIQKRLKEKFWKHPILLLLKEKHGEKVALEQFHELALWITDTLGQFWSFDKKGRYHLNEAKVQELEKQVSKDFSLKFSASLWSRTPALFGGASFSAYPAVGLTTERVYKYFWCTFWGNQDLVDPTSSANLFAVRPFINIGGFQLGAERDFQDHNKEQNLVAPYGVYSKKIGEFNLSVMGGFAHIFEKGQQVWVLRPGLEKKFEDSYLQTHLWLVKTPNGLVYKGSVGLRKEIAPNLTLEALYLVEEGKSGFVSAGIKYDF